MKLAPINETEELFVRDARRAGLSDGYYGYAADPGDWSARARKAYLDAHSEGDVKNHTMERLASLFGAAIGKRLTYAELIA